ncbi:hypothetical protein ADUPG1_004640, partial [Aduncisulcus paluster]
MEWSSASTNGKRQGLALLTRSRGQRKPETGLIHSPSPGGVQAAGSIDPGRMFAADPQFPGGRRHMSKPIKTEAELIAMARAELKVHADC